MEPVYKQSDEALCQLASSGDRIAEECLVARYNRLVRMCARPYFLAGGDSEDLIQEGMIGLLSAVRGYLSNRDTSFHTYAEVCIRNRLRSAVKAATRDKHIPLNHSVSLGVLLLAENSGTLSYNSEHYQENPEDVLINVEEEKSRMNALCSRLSDFEQTVLHLYLNGLSYGEIAQQVGKDPKAIDNAVQRIRRKVAPYFSSGDISVS